MPSLDGHRVPARNGKVWGRLTLLVLVVGLFTVLHYTVLIPWLNKQEAAREMSEAERIAASALTTERLEVKVRELKDEVLYRIRNGADGVSGESSGYVAAAGSLFYTNDPSRSNKDVCQRIGGRRHIECDSWGSWQFKLTTIIHYHEVLYGETLTEVEALLIALDEEKAKALAEAIIFGVEGGVWNWSTTIGDEDYYRRTVPLVRELEEMLAS